MPIDKFGVGREFDEWSQKLQSIMDEMLKRSFVHFRDSGEWQPAMNVYETRDAVHICVELAGVEHERISVECAEGRLLRLSGRRDQPRPDGECGPLSLYLMEINEGAFRREIELPEQVEMDAIDATYSRGYLWIRLPRASKP